jgi:23S rRNA pseudouridine1911/1915/1917 synthase
MKEERSDQSSSAPKFWVVERENAGIRLDAFLHRLLPHISLSQLKKALDEAAFRVDNKSRKKGYLLRGGERVSFLGPENLLAKGPVPRRLAGVEIVYEDEVMLVVDKPAGIATHGFSARQSDSLANHLVAIRPDLRGIGKNPWEVGLVHRLDRETSGLVLVAKDQQVLTSLRAQFRNREVRKKYWALLSGEAAQEGCIEYPIAHDPKNRRKMKTLINAAAHRGKKRWPAVTRYRTLARHKRFSLVEVEMLTGVTHQIRVHFAALGCPLVGDNLYGTGQGSSPRLERHFLHAFYLGCRHPKTDAPVAWKSPMPADLRATLAALQIAF